MVEKLRSWGLASLSIASLAAFLLILHFLPSLGATHHDSDKKLVEVWGWNIAAMSLDSLRPEFAQIRPDVEVVITRSGANMQSRFLLSLAADVGAPSVSQLQEREVGKFTSSGRLFDLTDLAAKHKEDFPAAFWSSCQYDGRTFALPWDIGPCAVFYKRWIFKRYDIDVDAIHTWDDFIEVGKQIQKASNGDTHMMPLDPLGGLADTFQILMQQCGGGIFDEHGQIIIHHPKNKQALQVLRKFIDSGITAPIQGPEYFASIGTDAVACYPTAVWFMQSVKDYSAGTEGDWGVFRLPAMEPGGLRASNLGGSVLVIPDQGEHKEAAWQFIEFTNCRVESQVAQYRDFGLFPAYLPALKDPLFDAPDPFFAGQRVHRLFATDIENIPPMVRTTDWNEAERYLKQTLSTWANNNLDNESYLRDAAHALSRKLGRPVAPLPNDGGLQ